MDGRFGRMEGTDRRTDLPTTQPTNKPTDMRAYRRVTLPIRKDLDNVETPYIPPDDDNI